MLSAGCGCRKISEIILYGSGLEFDVSYPLNSDIQYIHKVIDNRNVYFFANMGKSYIQTEVTLRGKIGMEEWDPHTGGIRNAKAGEFDTDKPDPVQFHRSHWI